eukprot:462357_1
MASKKKIIRRMYTGYKMKNEKNTHGNIYIYNQQNLDQWKWNLIIQLDATTCNMTTNWCLIMDVAYYLMNTLQYINFYLLIYYQLIYFNILMVFVDMDLIYYFIKTLQYAMLFEVEFNILLIKYVGIYLMVFGGTDNYR